MSEYMFGVSTHYNAPMPAREQQHRRRIAKRHGVTFCAYREPGRKEWRYWFAGPNLGYPFDRRLSAAVMADVAPLDDHD